MTTSGRGDEAKSNADGTGSGPALPLAGLRVLDLSQVMAGPYCCMLLGDMGADVIKVEPPTVGDQTRKSMGFRMKGEDSPGFLALNRNKRSIPLNLKSDAGRKVLHKLVETADIVVENSRPGVTKKLGSDYDTLSKINPRLIYASISGFGQTGPWSQRPGFDLIAQAMTGVISAMGTPGGRAGQIRGAYWRSWCRHVRNLCHSECGHRAAKVRARAIHRYLSF